jgi:LPS sulfotransferase NodH
MFLLLWCCVSVTCMSASMVPDVRATFAIVFVRSSGSTLLCSLLNAQAQILCHDEYVGKSFESVLKIARVPLRQVDKALHNSGFSSELAADKWFRHVDANCTQAKCLSPSEMARQRSFAVGFKQKAELLFASAPRLCERWGTRFVFVVRRNPVAHTVSIMRKDASIRELQQSGRVVRFFTNHNGQSRTQRTARWRQPAAHANTNRGKVGSIAPQPIVWKDFLQAFDEARASRLLLEHFENATQPCALRIFMEDLLLDQLATLRRVVEHINGSSAGMQVADLAAQQRILKTSPRDWRDGVSNFEGFRSDLRANLPAFRHLVDD